MSVNLQPQSLRQQAPGTATQTGTATPAPLSSPTAILRLRGAHPPTSHRVQWAEDVIDNEGLGRKSSKVCCIYHAPKVVGESSDESSSDSDSDSTSSSSSDSDSDSGDTRDYDPRAIAAAKRRAKDRQQQQHRHGPDCAHGREHDHAHSERDSKPKPARRPSPNAYERQPRYKPRNDDRDAGPSGSSNSPSSKK